MQTGVWNNNSLCRNSTERDILLIGIKAVMGIRHDTRTHKGVTAEGVCGTYKPAHCCNYAESSSYSIFNEGDTFLSSKA